MTKEQLKRLKAVKGKITIQDGFCNAGIYRFKVDGLEDGSFTLPKNIKNPFTFHGDFAVEDNTGFEVELNREKSYKDPFPALGDKIGEVDIIKGLYLDKYNKNNYYKNCPIQLKDGYFYLTDNRFMIKKKTTCPDSFSRHIDLS